MSDYTSKLNLYKVDPAIDGEDTFNIKSMMNDNWDKIDEKVGNMDEKLSCVEDNANNYNHPDTHDADMIRIKDESGKFTGDNVEDALGEVGSQLGDMANQQGNLTSLQTTVKSDLVGALNEVFQDADNGKADIFNAIVGKEITPSSQDFSDLVIAIENIVVGKKIAYGKTILDYDYYSYYRKDIIINIDWIPSVGMAIPFKTSEPSNNYGLVPKWVNFNYSGIPIGNSDNLHNGSYTSRLQVSGIGYNDTQKKLSIGCYNGFDGYGYTPNYVSVFWILIEL